MTTYDKINKFVAKNDLLPDGMHGTKNKCVITYDKANVESKVFNQKLATSIWKCDQIWNTLSLEIVEIDDYTTQYIIREVK